MVLRNYVCAQKGSVGKSIAGSIINATPFTNSTGYQKSWGVSNGFFLALGDGDTPPTVTDYKLDSPFSDNTVLNNVSQTQNSAVLTDWNSPSFREFTYVFQNISSSSVTVKEIGFFSRNGSNYFLIARKVLDTPVTFAPNEQYAFTYIIQMD